MLKHALILAAILVSAGCYAAPSDSPVVNFEAVWSEFDLLYGGFGIRQVDWDDAHEQWRPTVEEDSTDTELFNSLAGMLTVFDDTHVQIQAPGRELWFSGEIYRKKLYDDRFDLEVVKTYLSNIQSDPDEADYVWGELEPGIAYIWFPWTGDNTYVIDEVIDSGASRIIVDLRHNGGGQFMYALEAFGRAAPTDVEVFRTRTRTGADGEFGDWFTTKMLARGETYDGDIVVLTDRWTVSAGERLVMALKELPNVVVMGEPTNGAIATMVPREMPNGWIYTIPVQEVVHMDGEISEGPGVPVDITLVNDPALLAAGTDELLEAAIALQ